MTAPTLTPSALATMVESAELGAGLADVSRQSLKSAYAQLLGGVTGLGGSFVRAEAGYRPWENLALFAGGGYERSTGWGAGVGARWSFDL